MRRASVIGAAIALLAPGVYGADDDAQDTGVVSRALKARDDLESQGWLVHGQTTYILQGHPKFRSPYSGPSSMTDDTKFRGGTSAGPVVGRKLWDGAEFFVNPELDMGAGLSESVGAAGYPNNEAFRVGSTYPKITIPRMFVRQVIGLGGSQQHMDRDQLQFGEDLDEHRLTITVGKFSVWDVFDDNKYSHDARTQFLNWVLVGNGAIDFAADARGYTTGAAIDYNRSNWAARAGLFQVSKEVNSKRLDDHVLDGYQVLAELEQRYSLFDRPGKIRELGMVDRTRAITYQASYGGSEPVNADDPLPGFRRYRVNYGVGLNLEQELTDVIGIFSRVGWNPGRVQEFMFTEVDQHASAGVSVKGNSWDRPDDTAGVAGIVNRLSDHHRAYYGAGNIGFIVGDGRLRYQPEEIIEAFYDVSLYRGLEITGDYQLIRNPGYNADRGPISIFGLRMHAQF